MASISYQKEIPVRYQAEIFIAGGGPSGIAAALAAAGQGRKVFLAEAQSCLGGLGTAGMVPGFVKFGDGENFLADGIGRLILDSLSHEKGPDYPGSIFSIPAELLKRVYDRLLLQAGVKFTFQTQVIDVIRCGEVIDMVLCQAKSGFFAVKAAQFIDCTGDGDIAVWAGAPHEKGDANGNMMPGTLCSLWAGVNFDGRDPKIDFMSVLKKSFADGIFTVPDHHHSGMTRVGKTLSGGNFGHAFGVDGTDERSITEFLIEGRARMPEFERFYREYVPGFENLELVGTGNLLGIRESRRIQGDYVLNVEDFKRRAVFPDEIGRYCYPVDIHPAKPTADSYAAFEKEYRKDLRYEKGESYGIPYRCLIPRNVSNLLVAGRCVSCDQKMQASIRVMPGCCITGQAAGMAAALCCEGNINPRAVNVGDLQKRLKKIGAWLPNAQ